MGEILKEIFTDQNFLGALLSSLFFILIGFFLRRGNLIKENGKETLNVIVMNVAIPCLAFCAFMSDLNEADLGGDFVILLLDFLFYFIVILLSYLGFFRYQKTSRMVFAILISIGQLTLFSIPILKNLYVNNVSDVLIPASLMTLAFRFMTYVVAYLSISETKIAKDNIRKTLKSIFLTPVMIAMLLGLFIYLTQNVFFQVEINGESYGFLRIDKTLPMLYKVFELGDKMATPLCFLMIGVTLGECKLLDALKNKMAWLIASLRVFVVPLFILCLCLMIQAFNWFHFSEFQLAALVIGNAAPVGAVVGAYCLKFQKEAYLASDSIFLSTALSLISIPLCFVLLKLCLTLPIFN